MPTRADEREEGVVLATLPELNPTVSESLDVVIQKAMALTPEDRYPSVGTLRKALEPFGSVRPARPERPAAPSSWRIVAGLLDAAAVMLLLAALTVELELPLEQVILTGVLLWAITRLLLLLITRTTPGMLLMGLRLTDQGGGPITLKALLFRTVMFMATVIILRLRPDSQDLFLHDRMSGSRIVVNTRNE